MRLDTLISFYEPVTTKSASGQDVVQYRKLLTAPDMFAELNDLPSKAKEQDEGKQRVASSMIEFGIRYRADLNRRMVILAQGMYYDIIKITPIRRNMYLMIEAEEKDNDWTIDILTP
jgi:head-tail adaptor